MRDRKLNRLECGKLCVTLLCVISRVLGEAIFKPGWERKFDRLECGKLCVTLLCVISRVLGEAIFIPG